MSDAGLAVAETAKAWGTTPSRLVGLPAGSVEALELDVQLARLLPARQAERRLAGLLERAGPVEEAAAPDGRVPDWIP